MGHGIQLAFNEISLVLFTTLAPSGVVALMLMGAPLLFGRVSGEKARRIDCFMGIPLAVSMVGLVMSATHLGNPDNILYVSASLRCQTKSRAPLFSLRSPARTGFIPSPALLARASRGR